MLKLFINEMYTQYLELQVSKHIDDLAGSFNIKVLKKYNPGDRVKIGANKQVLLNGYIDVSKCSLSNKGKIFQISGRDKTGDLVDSCLESSESQKEKSLIQIARKYVKDFDIKVSGPDTKLSYTPTPGNTIFKSLSDIAIKDNLRIVTRSGMLSFEKINPETKPLFSFVEGKNIISISLTEDHRRRFKRYIARTLVQGISENYNYDDVITDDEIKRKRTLLFTSDRDQEQECQFQKDIRKAKSKVISLVVHGFDAVPDVLNLVQIRSPSLSINGSYVIVGFSFIYNHEQKKLLKIQLADPKSFNQKQEEPQEGW